MEIFLKENDQINRYRHRIQYKTKTNGKQSLKSVLAFLEKVTQVQNKDIKNTLLNRRTKKYWTNIKNKECV